MHQAVAATNLVDHRGIYLEFKDGERLIEKSNVISRMVS